MAASLAVVDAGSAFAVQAIAATVLISQIVHLQPDAAIRNAAAMTVAGIAGLGFVWSRIAELVLVNDVRARLAVDETRQSLEARVNEQMKEIFANIEEIARLNRQLDAQVQQRSRELSLALARLAEGASGRRTITPGTIVGMRFVVDAPLNTGGSVWLADDRVTNSKVVLRVGQATSAGELDVFNKILGEIDALTTARHPVFVRTIHIDLTNDGFLVQALEYVPGLSLDRWIATHGVLPALVVARIGALLAEGLAAAHEKGIVHRDVTTANVLVSTFSPGVRLIGFGAARSVTEQSGGPQTLLSGVSPEFLAPESIGGDAVDGRADVYCLGLVLYAALTARTPYAPTTGAGWLKAHAVEPPKPLRELAPHVPVELEAIVMSCLRKNRDERPTASELGERLLKLANERAAGTVDEFVRGIDADSTDVRRIASG
jgi:serine/threonine-protein kinase